MNIGMEPDINHLEDMLKNPHATEAEKSQAWLQLQRIRREQEIVRNITMTQTEVSE